MIKRQASKQIFEWEETGQHIEAQDHNVRRFLAQNIGLNFLQEYRGNNEKYKGNNLSVSLQTIDRNSAIRYSLKVFGI